MGKYTVWVEDGVYFLKPYKSREAFHTASPQKMAAYMKEHNIERFDVNTDFIGTPMHRALLGAWQAAFK